jgi:hypothetical protein
MVGIGEMRIADVRLTHCLHGHDRKIFFYRTPSGHPVCRACNSIATKKYYKKTLAIKKNMVYN